MGKFITFVVCEATNMPFIIQKTSLTIFKAQPDPNKIPFPNLCEVKSFCYRIPTNQLVVFYINIPKAPKQYNKSENDICLHSPVWCPVECATDLRLKERSQLTLLLLLKCFTSRAEAATTTTLGIIPL